VGAGAVGLGEAFGGAGIVAGTVQRLAPPLWIAEASRSLLGLVRLEQALALLVRAQPQVVPAQRVARLRVAEQ
jgi:hypothetical protein